MNDLLQQDLFTKMGVNFEDDEVVEVATYFHKNPNVVQVIAFRAMSPGLTGAYFLLLTNKKVILVPMNNNAIFKHEKASYLAFDDIKILKESGTLEIKVNEKKHMRLSFPILAPKSDRENMKKFLKSLRDKQ